MDLFTRDEFASYLQVPLGSLNDGTVSLLLELVTGLVQQAYGVTAIPVVAPSAVKLAALESAKRSYLNPASARTAAVGQVSTTYDVVAPYLTSNEVRAIRAVAGVDDGSARSVSMVQPDIDYALTWP